MAKKFSFGALSSSIKGLSKFTTKVVKPSRNAMVSAMVKSAIPQKLKISSSKTKPIKVASFKSAQFPNMNTIARAKSKIK
jgi:hypothetical protein